LRTDIYKEKVLKQYLPKFIRDRIRSRTEKIFTPERADFLPFEKAVAQGRSLLCICHNFFMGMILSFLRMNDQAFPKNKGRLQDSSVLPPQAMVAINKWIIEIWILQNNRTKLKIKQDPRSMSPWNAYLQVLNFPACIGPVSSVGQKGSEGEAMSAIDTSTSAFPSNIGSSMSNNTSEPTNNMNANMRLSSITVHNSSSVSRLPSNVSTNTDNTTDKESKKDARFPTWSHCRKIRAR
jgi:hypothetical protein